jgi:hypothetical protein
MLNQDFWTRAIGFTTTTAGQLRTLPVLVFWQAG